MKIIDSHLSKSFKQSRRQFLSMATKAGFGLPLATGMLSSRMAHADTHPFRVVFFFVSNGAQDGKWLPSGNGAGMSMNEGTQTMSGVKQYCNFRELRMVPDSGHGNEFKSMGRLAWGPNLDASSIDVQISNVIGGSTPFKNIYMAVKAGSNYISRVNGNMLSPESDPASAIKTYFSGGGNSGGDGAKNFDTNILDVNLAELKALRANLGGQEKQRLDEHENAIETLQQRIANAGMNMGGGECKSEFMLPSGMNFGQEIDAYTDIIASVFSCGISKVATLQLDDSQGGWKVPEVNSSHDYHNAFHNRGAPNANNIQYTQFVFGKLAKLIDTLAKKDDPIYGGKILDNTVVVQVTDMGDGAGHSAPNAPHVTASGANMTGFKRGTAANMGAVTTHDTFGDLARGLGLSSAIGSQISDFSGGTGILS